MYQTDSWRIEAPQKGLRIYREDEVSFRRASKVFHSPELNAHIEEVWKIELQRNPKLTVGSLLRLTYLYEYKNENLELGISLTDYPEYKATCVPEHKRRFEKNVGRTFRSDERAHTFASAVLPVTLDDKVVFLERSYNVDLFKGFLNLPSGGVWDGDPKETIKKLIYHSPGLFGVCRAIVEREFRKKESEIRLSNESPKLYGVVETLEHGESTFDDHVLEFSIKLDESSDDVQRKKDKIAVGKYGNLVLVDFEEARFADFLNTNLKRIPESIQPVAIIAGAHKFGEEWPLSIKGVRKIKK